MRGFEERGSQREDNLNCEEYAIQREDRKSIFLLRTLVAMERLCLEIFDSDSMMSCLGDRRPKFLDFQARWPGRKIRFRGSGKSTRNRFFPRACWPS